MTYKNYLTTPSGRFCEVSDVTNGDYVVLIKYLQGQNYAKFFEAFNEVIRRDLPDFDSYDVVEKCYIYLAYCMYSIRSNITVNNKHLGDQEVDLSIVLNNIESSYNNGRVESYEICDNFVLKFGYPKNFYFTNDAPVVDYYSGLIGFNDTVMDEEQKVLLKDKLGTKTMSFIDDFLREKFNEEVDLFHGVPMNSMKIKLLSESMVANVVGVVRMPLESFYQILYASIKHLRMSYSDFMKISQVEATILLNHVAEENKKMMEESGSGSIGTIGRMIENEV